MAIFHKRLLFFLSIALVVGAVYFNLAGHALAQEPTGDADKERSLDIVGGKAADPGEYPWQVMLLDSSGRFFCGGSLIHAKWVLTAGHCTYGITVSRVVLGAHDRTNSSESSRQTITVLRTIRHPNYNDNTTDNDLALLELSQPATLNNRVAIIPYVISPGDDALFAAGVNSVVTGWGATSEGGSSPAILQEVTVPIVSQDICRQAYGSSLTNNMLCAGLTQGGKDSCQGDSGGPLSVSSSSGRKLAGIVSWGNGCARPGFYGIYTRVANYTAWIQQYVPSSGTPTATPTKGTPVATPTKTPTPVATPTKTPTPIPTAGSNALQNGNFEQGRNGTWTESSSNGYALITSNLPATPASGVYAAWLAGAHNETSRLSQSLKLPAAAPKLYLIYKYWAFSNESRCTYDLAYVYLNTTRIQSVKLCSASNTNGWVRAVIDITKYAGKNYTVQFYAKTDSSLISHWLIDDVIISTSSTARSEEEILQPEDIEEGAGEEQLQKLFLPVIVQ